MDFDPSQLASALRKDEIDIGDLPNSQGGSFATGMINALKSGFALPGDVATGQADIRLPSESPDLTRVADMTGVMTAGSLPAATRASGEAMLGSGPIRAYHGSPHDFDRFDLSKIGTGEGAQAYGHGLYFAENPETAVAYRNQLEGKHGTSLPPSMMQPERLARDILDMTGGDRDKALGVLNERLNSYLKADPKYQAPDGYDRFMSAMQTIRSGKEIPGGKMYEVAIHADPERFLQWDKPLTKQTTPVKETLADLGIHAGDSGGQIYHALATDHPLIKTPGYPDATATLREAGIPGIRYRDQGSRGLDGGSGTHNIVAFDDKIVEILKKYGVASMTALPPAVQMMLLPNDHPRDGAQE